MGQVADFSGFITQKVNDLENRLIPQIDYHIILHIILKLYIQKGLVEFKTVGTRGLRPNYFSSNSFQHSVRTQQKIYFTTGKNGAKASLKLQLHFYMQIQTNVLSFYKSQNFLYRSNLFQQDQKLNRI